MKQPRLAIPILLKTQKEIMTAWQQAAQKADLAEIWLDQIKNIDYQKLFAHKPCPVIVTAKAKEEKGKFKGSEEERIDRLIKSAQAGADYIDISWRASQKLKEKILQKKQKAKVIFSYHDFEKTPKITTLTKIAMEMNQAGADLVKIITTAKKNTDNLILFELSDLLAKKRIKHLVWGMGPRGKVSRLITPLLGAEWMFAPLNSKAASAPGQVPVHHLKNFWAAVRG